MIAPGTDWPVAVAARIAEKLGLPHPISPATAVLATNKLRQRERFAAAGVPQPRWQVVDATARPSSARPASSRRPTGRARRGSRSCSTTPSSPDAIELARARVARAALVLVEESSTGPR